MRKYNLINNVLGWVCFVVAAATYLLTLEPTASFWDCPEFISQGYKLEVGHPPGNPIFMLAARFFVNFAGGDVGKVAVAVNSMSALLSAATILLLFWTITHLVRRLIVADDFSNLNLPRMLAIFGSGICGALAYTWSDTFWFSAVEGEVYAFSSFCTALVFWLILKWENRAEQPHSDRYLILIAYVIGISIAVHLLNLLCIPAIALVIYYRKFKETTATGSLVTLAVAAAVVALILYGLVPGFIEIAQYFELFFVNTVGLSYNVGVLIYAIILVATLVWSVRALYRQRSATEIRWSFLLAVILSGIPFIGRSWVVPVLIIGALAWWLFSSKKLPVRILTISALSVLVIFVGYSSYALLLIRSNANPPMNQNAPDNVFALASYLNREQYGDTPLFYGPSFKSSVVVQANGTGSYDYRTIPGKTVYDKVVKQSPDEPDRYVVAKEDFSYDMAPKMLFPRMYSTSGSHPQGYLDWAGISADDIPMAKTAMVLDADGKPVQYEDMPRPTFAQNLRYFFNYQLNHMYWRYFMWNFAGRQNDLAGNGEPNRGNWISGIPFIDNPRLGDQSLLPADIGSDNKGHNVFYMLPLLMGLLGLLWQAFVSKRGIEQFWVIFFLFFMTGIAIVLYLNQPPMQPRERDYAFAGSFYAFAIWVGMGVAALWALVCRLLSDGKKGTDATDGKKGLAVACAACAVGLLVPLQMVSQTWDDHDRSGRYTTRDFGFNYLSSLDENAIIFTNGDNDTFPLWYAQEVEGFRTDVRVVNLSYLTTDWYANQMRIPTYNNDNAIEFSASPADYAFDRLQYNYYSPVLEDDSQLAEVHASLDDLYHSPNAVWRNNRLVRYPAMYIPVDSAAAVEAGVVSPREARAIESHIVVDLLNDPENRAGGATLSQALSLDMIATSIKNGWNRPTYFAMTVPDEYYLSLTPYLRSTGLAYAVTPVHNGQDMGVDTDKAYRNITERFRWGGLDQLGDDGDIYLDETVRRMVTTHRTAMIDLAKMLFIEGYYASQDSEEEVDSAFVADRYAKSAHILQLIEEKLPVKHSPYGIQSGYRIADVYFLLADATGQKEYREKGLEIVMRELRRYAPYLPYFMELRRTRAGGGFAALSYSDRYIPTYLELLLQAYAEEGGNIDELTAMLKSLNVNIADLDYFVRRDE